MTTTYDYAHIQASADGLLAKYGAAVAIRRTTNAGTQWDPTQTTTDYATKAVVTNFPRWYSAFANDNSDVLRTDRMVYLSMGPLVALGISAVLPNDLFVFNGSVFQIIDAKPVYPAGTPVIYILQIRI